MISEKKLYNLLIKQQHCSEIELHEITTILCSFYFKPLISQISMQNVIPFLIPYQCEFQECLFEQGQKIQEYYFICDGAFNLYRNFKSQKQQLYFYKNGPSVVGQYFVHSNVNRVYTAVCSDRSGGRGFKINVQKFNNLFGNLIAEYKNLKCYISSMIGVHNQVLNKIQVYNHCKYEKLQYNSNITLEKAVYIIIQGQCLIYKKKEIFLPSLPKMNLMVKYKEIPLIKLCENDCINLDSYYNNAANYSYKVTSQQIIFLLIPFEYIKLYPLQLELHFKALHQIHQIKAQQFNFQQNEKDQFQRKTVKINYESKLNNYSVSRRQLSQIRKNYCLSFNSGDTNILQNRKQQPKVVSLFQKEKKIKQKENLLKKREWKDYIKLPPLFNDIKIMNNNNAIKAWI